MKKLSYLPFLTLLLACLLFVSCQNNELLSIDDTGKSSEVLNFDKNVEDASVQGSFSVRQGIVHFKNLDAYLKTKSELSKLQEPERLEFSKKNGIESQLVLTVKAVEEFSNASDAGVRENILQKYQNQVYVEDGTLKRKIRDGGAAPLLNKDGIVFIGKMAYRFDNGKETIALDGDISKLSEASLRSKEKSLSVLEYSTFNNVKNAKVCSNMSVEKLENSLKSVGRAWISFYKYYATSTTFNCEAHAYYDGTPNKHPWWDINNNNWTDFTTNNNLKWNFAININDDGKVGTGNVRPPFSSSTILTQGFIGGYTNYWNHIDFDAYTTAYNISNARINNIYCEINDTYTLVATLGSYKMDNVSDLLITCP